MKAAQYHNDIHMVLKDLIDLKSKRDRTPFTLAQLARELGMPHSILSKLTHEDPVRRVNNPRIDTLSKIVNFFKNDGFDISIETLLEGLKDPAESLIQQRNFRESAIPLYFFDSDLKTKIGTVSLEIAAHPANLIALVSDEFIEPMFKKGSVFVIDTVQEPEHDNLVAVQIPGHEKIVIRKLFKKGRLMQLKLYDKDPEPLTLHPTFKYKMIGVVIQANAKT